MHSTRRRIMAALAALVMTTTACGGGGGELTIEGSDIPGRFGMATVMTAAEPFLSAQITTLCIEGSESVKLTSVRADSVEGDIEILDFAAPAGLVSDFSTPLDHRPLKEAFPRASRTVKTPCGDTVYEANLYIEVPRPKTASARISGLTIEASNGKTYHLNVELMTCRRRCPS